MSKLITLYHGTDEKSFIKIIKKGFQSHTWFATNSKRALIFGKIKTDNPRILIIKISKDELKERALVKQPTSAKKSNKIIGYEYLLHSYRLPKLQPTLLQKSD